MPKRIIVILMFIASIFGIFLYRVYSLAYQNRDFYLNEARAINEVYVSGSSAPRGRILDVNGNILVDNIGVNTIYYHKPSGVTLKDELFVAEELVKITNYEYMYDIDRLKKFYSIINSSKVDSLITEEEYQLYSERKLTSQDLSEMKMNRITDDMINSMSDLEKYSSYFYFLMNEGYSYDNKCLIENASEEIYASVLERNFLGIFGEMEWKRVYNYGDTLKTIFGEISNSLPAEKDYLLDRGYSLTDKVGISGLEEYYEEYLKGKKAIYKVGSNNSLELVKEAKRGADLVLEIDINIQMQVEEIIKEEILKAKKTANTEFYKESYALISDPLTGSIKAIAGIRLITNGKDSSFQDVSINVIKNAYTVGSAVKGASMAVGYKNGIIDIGTSITDGCVKLKSMPAKCSYKRLGRLNDVEALALSSNYYQFIIALGIMGYNYTYNMEAEASMEHFNLYRNTFAEFGLGAKTGIDLPNESSGLKGETVAPDLLMNLAIGQYDLYTPVELLQYINTIASSGTRRTLSLMHSVINGDEILLEHTNEVLNQVELEDKYIKRIQDGFRSVMKSGTGYWYINTSIPAAGKTGTSESYIDNDLDGNLESFVLSNTFLMYAPYDNPKYSIVVISPNTSNLNSNSKYRSPVNRLIARSINDFLFSS
ncbi:MAG TPA: penicillin-binding protein 2 [Candidatus Caccenecus avistercoris]|nr:penicillin-binding protein 2 [Candidatus Caccenecus avistercoris]